MLRNTSLMDVKMTTMPMAMKMMKEQSDKESEDEPENKESENEESENEKSENEESENEESENERPEKEESEDGEEDSGEDDDGKEAKQGASSPFFPDNFTELFGKPEGLSDVESNPMDNASTLVLGDDVATLNDVAQESSAAEDDETSTETGSDEDDGHVENDLVTPPKRPAVDTEVARPVLLYFFGPLDLYPMYFNLLVV